MAVNCLYGDGEVIHLYYTTHLCTIVRIVDNMQMWSSSLIYNVWICWVLCFCNNFLFIHVCCLCLLWQPHAGPQVVRTCLNCFEARCCRRQAKLALGFYICFYYQFISACLLLLCFQPKLIEISFEKMSQE